MDSGKETECFRGGPGEGMVYPGDSIKEDMRCDEH